MTHRAKRCDEERRYYYEVTLTEEVITTFEVVATDFQKAAEAARNGDGVTLSKRSKECSFPVLRRRERVGSRGHGR